MSDPILQLGNQPIRMGDHAIPMTMLLDGSQMALQELEITLVNKSDASPEDLQAAQAAREIVANIKDRLSNEEPAVLLIEKLHP
jgi:hypothetical protein